MKSRAQEPPAKKPMRGLSLAPQKRDGYPVAQLTDSQDRLIASVSLVPGIDRTMVRRVMRELLDAADPKPTLELVR